MATETLPGGYGELQLAGASKGVACSTTVARTVIPRGTGYISLMGRAYSTAVVIRWNLNPWLAVLKTTDSLATGANLTDYSEEAQDNSTATDVTLSSLPTSGNGGALYIGSWCPFSGVVVDVDAANSTASVLSVTYRKSDNTWANITPSDGTASGGATFAQDGNVTWTVPTDWITCALADVAATGSGKDVGILKQPMFWTKWTVSAALDSSTTLNSMGSISRLTTYAELVASVPWEQAVKIGPGGWYSLNSLTDAGTASLLINCAARSRFAS